MVPYSAKLVSYQVPSGVLEPVNEYSFSQAEDGEVTVSHKISARGIKNSVGGLDNAIAFVKNFVKQNPYTGCAPTFIQNGSGILLNFAESIDRASCTYTVNETYKFITGSTLPYLESTTLGINDSNTEDYTVLDLSIKWQGSPVTNNLSQLQSTFTGLSATQILNNYGISTTNVFLNSFSLNQDSGQALIEMKASFLSGLANDLSGIFDYSVSMDEDSLNRITSWKIDGDFICKGPISFRRTQLNSFETLNKGNSYIPYLFNLLKSSAIYSGFGGTFTLNPMPTQLSINENTGLATLKLSATFSDADTYLSYYQPKYSIDCEPSRWIYELMPSANIEGHYIVQDLQMRNQAKIRLSFNYSSTGATLNANDLNGAFSYLNTLSGLYVLSGFLQNEAVSSGINERSVDQEIIGQETQATSFLTSKVFGSIGNTYIRPKGYKFGF
jgi:hypothetical protein